MSVVTPQSVVQWAQGLYTPFALTWEEAKPLPKLRGMRVLGRAPNDAALVDISCDIVRQSVKQVSMVCPIGGDYVHLVTHTLALLHPKATLRDADHWYARVLTGMSAKAPRRLRAWGIWLVDIQITAQGLMAILIRRRI